MPASSCVTAVLKTLVEYEDEDEDESGLVTEEATEAAKESES